MTFEELQQYSNNPARAINRVFQDIEDTIGVGPGSINAKGHPFAYLIDMVVASQYNFITRNGDGIARRFPVHARTVQDLTPSMSDEDWHGVFSEPSECTFRWIIAEEELYRKAIPFTETASGAINRYNKLVLPQDTVFTVANIPFLLENPVEIRVMEHGGVQVVYDSSNPNPLRPLVTNSPDKDILDIDGRRYLCIVLPIRQLAVKEHPNRPVNAATGFSQAIEYTDKLYAIRAFITPDGSSKRSEMAVVYNNDVYDPAQPTLTVDLINDGTFQASIPSVYLQNGTGLGRVTILVYTTRGVLETDLSTMSTKQHSVAYYDFNNAAGKLGSYSDPLRKINDVTTDTITPITGGLNAATFQEMKNLVIYGHRRRQIPVSNNDLTQTLLRNGFENVKAIDFVTNRMYRTTKDLPIQQNKLFDGENISRINSSIGTYTGTYLAAIDELVASGNAIDNNKRITIPRGAVFDITEQTAALIPKHEADRLRGASNQIKIDTMSERSMVYTPFMYVIDTSDNRASIRTYRVDRPLIKYQTFRYQNANLGITAGVGAINIKVTKESYIIELRTNSSDSYKELPDAVVGIQLNLPTSGTTAPAVMRGNLKGIDKTTKERIWEFVIPTRFDIDVGDEIDLRGMNQFGREQEVVRSLLDTVATFIFTYTNDGQVLTSTSDGKIDQTLFNGVTISIVETDYKLTFGKRLSALYTRIRPIVGPAQYAKYTDNVPAVYAEDVYEYKDKKLVIKDGKAVILHRKGEVRLNAQGGPVWEHEKGTTVFDQDGKPVLLHPRKLKYHWDFLGFDFNYILSEDAYDSDYVGLVEDFFANEVNDWLEELNRVTLDETVIMFKPRSTMGFTQVILNEGVEKTIRTDVDFVITYYLTDEGMTDNDLKTSLTRNTHIVTNEHLRRRTFSVSELNKVLKTPDVLDIKIIATAGAEPVDVITNIDDTNGFSVTKELDQTSDQLLTIKEGIEILFKRHMPR